MSRAPIQQLDDEPETSTHGLPEGWVETALGNCVDILDHLRVPVNSTERGQRRGNVAYYGATGQVGWIDDYLFDEESRASRRGWGTILR